MIRRPRLIAVLTLGLSTAAVIAQHSARSSVPQVDPSLPAGVERLTVSAKPVPFSRNNPAQRRTGALTWLGGFALSSPDGRFGGISAMRFLPDGRLLALSDTARWFVLNIEQAGDGRLTGVGGELTAPLLDFAGQPLDKANGDAESFDMHMVGVDVKGVGLESVVIGFEGRTRLSQYIGPFTRDVAKALVARPARDYGLEALGPVPSNGGPEAFAFTGKRDDWIVVSEEGVGPGGQPAALIRRRIVDAAGRRLEQMRVGMTVTPGFKPTDAAMLDDGRLLLLTRRYIPVIGVSAELLLFDLARASDGAVLVPKHLGRLDEPLAVDNMEALAVSGPPGRRILTLMSDDNFNPLQRTLILRFGWDETKD